MNKIKFAVVGFGNIGKRHVHHILAHPEAQLVAVCDADERRFTTNTLPEGILKFNQLDEMLDQITADVLNVCTPNFLHEAHCIQAMKHGLHTVCEKPMATSSLACENMIAASEQSGQSVFVVKQNRYNEPVQAVKKLLEENRLGKVFMIQVNCFWNRNEHYYNESKWRGKKIEDGGCLFTQFSHFVDILFYLFGEIESAGGRLQNFHHNYTEVEDSGSLIMTLQNGAMVNFNFSTCTYDKNMEGAITILAENGTVKIGGQYLNTIEYQCIQDVVIPEMKRITHPNDYGLYQGSMSNHDKVINNVVQTLKGKDSIMTNAYEGMKVVKMIEQMYAGCSV